MYSFQFLKLSRVSNSGKGKPNWQQQTNLNTWYRHVRANVKKSQLVSSKTWMLEYVVRPEKKQKHQQRPNKKKQQKNPTTKEKQKIVRGNRHSKPFFLLVLVEGWIFVFVWLYSIVRVLETCYCTCKTGTASSPFLCETQFYRSVIVIIIVIIIIIIIDFFEC